MNKEEMEVLFSGPMIVSIAVWLVTQIFFIVLMIRHKPHLKNRKVDEAIRRGHVVKGFSNGKWDGHNNRMRDAHDHSYRCDYVYQVNGKKMTYQYLGNTLPPYSVTLYYLDDPKKVFPDMEMNTASRNLAGVRFGLLYIIPLILAAFVYMTLSGR